MSGFRGFINSINKRILNNRVTVVKFRVNNGGGDGTGSYEIKIRIHTAKFTNMRTTRFRQRKDLVREISKQNQIASRI